MKRLLLLLTVVLMSTISYAQNNPYVVGNSYQPMTMEEMMVPFMLYSQNSERIQQIQEQRRQAAKQRFTEYKGKAYDCYNRNDYSGFIYYSAIALETGWYNDKMYYDRGVAFEALHDYKQAKKEYKMAINYGYYPAVEAYSQVKAHKKAWKKSQK